MCFSAQASFVAGSGLAVIAAVSVYSSRTIPTDRLYSTIPSFFAAHQLIEGALWIALSQHPKPPYTSALTYAFTLIAFSLWPLLVPLAIRHMEESPRRRRYLLWCCIAGATVCAIHLLCHIVYPPVAQIINHSIRYRVRYPLRLIVQNLYGFAVTGSCLISSHRWVNVFGIAIGLSYYYCFIYYRPTYESVWCYFAAVLSSLVLLHLRQRNRNLEQIAP